MSRLTDLLARREPARLRLSGVDAFVIDNVFSSLACARGICCATIWVRDALPRLICSR